MYFCQLYFIKTFQWLSIAFRIKSKPFIIAWSCLARTSLSIYSLPLAPFSCPDWTPWCPLKMEDHVLPRYILHASSLPWHILPFCLRLLAPSSLFKTHTDFASTGEPSLSLSPSSSSLAVAGAWDCALVKVPCPEYKISDARLQSCRVLCIQSAQQSPQMTIVCSLICLPHWTPRPTREVTKSLPPLLG